MNMCKEVLPMPGTSPVRSLEVSLGRPHAIVPRISSSFRLLLTAAACSLLTLSMGAPLQAQIDTGRIVGVVKDSSGAVIPGSNVTLTNEGTGLTSTVTTGPTGYYVFSGVRLGTYRIEVEAKGFEKFVRSGMTVHVQQDADVDITLVPGTMTQTVQVRADATMLQTEEASTGQTITSMVINDMPLNGRDWTSLAELGAGVTMSQYISNATDRTYVSGNGVMIEQNNYQINGMDNNSFTGAPQAYVVLPPPDAMAEFKVQTGNYNAEFGRSAGLVINGTVKSGTNRIHGDAWEFVRNDLFDAANFFENSGNLKKTGYKRNQFGATLGGPVYIPHLYNGKDKTFFFFSYEGMRLREPTTYIDTVPTASMVSSGFTNLQDLITMQSGSHMDNLGRTSPLGTVFDPATTRNVTAGQVDPVTGLTATGTGFVRDPFYQGSIVGVTGFMGAAEANLNLIPAARYTDPNAKKLMAVFPLPNRPGFAGDYVFNGPYTEGRNGTDERIDENISASDQLFFAGSWNHHQIFIPPLFGGIGGLVGGGTYGLRDEWADAYAIGETHSFSPTLINEVRVGWNQSHVDWGAANDYNYGIPAQYGIQGIPQTLGNGGLPFFTLSGLTQIGTYGWNPLTSTSRTWDLSDNVTKVDGAHTFKGGVQADFIFQPSSAPSWGKGGYGFDGEYTEIPNISNGGTGVAQLLLSPPIASSVPGGYNNVGGEDAVFASNLAGGSGMHKYFGMYFQDDWKVTQKLTVNLGLRWDHTDLGYNEFGASANFIPGPPGQAQIAYPKSRCNDPSDPWSPSYIALTAKDGIANTCSNNLGLGNTPITNFAPRIGLAYRLTPKLVLRGGYGIFYGALQWGSGGLGTGGGYPFSFGFTFFSPDAAHPLTYPDGTIATMESGLAHIPLTSAVVNAAGLGLGGRQWNTQTPYYEDFNATVEYQLTPNQTFRLAYVGNQDHHEGSSQGSINANSEILPPGLNQQNYVEFPDFGINGGYTATDVNGYYNSLQASFTRRFSGGLNLLANYTLANCRTDFTDQALGGGGYRAPNLAGFGIQGDYAPCSTQVKNVFHFSGNYLLPIGKGRRFLNTSSKAVDEVIGGWQINWIMTLQDGMPFTVGCSNATSSDFGCVANLVPGQNMYSGPHNVNNFLNVAAFANAPAATSIGQTNFAPLGGEAFQATGPPLRRVDFSMFKEFPLTESTHLEFRAEVFNLTNTPWFANPSSLSISNPLTFGRITSLVDGSNDPRLIQLALKLYW